MICVWDSCKIEKKRVCLSGYGPWPYVQNHKQERSEKRQGEKPRGE